MHRKSVYRKILILILCINIAVLLFFTYKELDDRIPDKIKIMVGENEDFNFNLPIRGNFVDEEVDVISVNNKTVPTDQIKLDLNKPFSLKSSKTGQYKINLKTDSTELYEYTLETIAEQGCNIIENIPNVYANGKPEGLLGIQTFYEGMHLADNRIIKFVSFTLPENPIVIPKKKSQIEKEQQENQG